MPDGHCVGQIVADPAGGGDNPTYFWQYIKQIPESASG